MKKNYEKPCLDIIEFAKEDIMDSTLSAPTNTIFDMNGNIEDLGDM